MDESTSEEDVIEQTVKGEARFFRGLMKEKHHKTPLRFCFSYCWGLLWFTLGGIFLILLIVFLIKATQQKVDFSKMIVPALFMVFFSFLSLGSGIRLIARLITLLTRKDRAFKIKTLFPLLILNGLVVLILISIFRSSLVANFLF